MCSSDLDFAELMMGSDYAAVDVYLEMDDLVMVDDELYVPFRKVVEQLGCTAVYDKANQVVYIEELGIVIEDFFILQGTSYVSSDALEEGFMLYNLVLSYYID